MPQDDIPDERWLNWPDILVVVEIHALHFGLGYDSILLLSKLIN